ncbi:MAG: hypothetical protein MJ244_05525 [Clostridia bacterium]|nr:hypothetical protein [Clostridia bacterium]
MAKTKEELNNLKQELETLTTKLQELTEDELKLVTGGGHQHPMYWGTTWVLAEEVKKNDVGSAKTIKTSIETQLGEYGIGE